MNGNCFTFFSWIVMTVITTELKRLKHWPFIESAY